MLKKTLESPLDKLKLKPAILRKINPKYSLKGLTLKLKLQYLSHLIRRVNSLGKIITLGKIEGKMRRGQ